MSMIPDTGFHSVHCVDEVTPEGQEDELARFYRLLRRVSLCAV